MLCRMVHDQKSLELIYVEFFQAGQNAISCLDSKGSDLFSKMFSNFSISKDAAGVYAPKQLNWF